MTIETLVLDGRERVVMDKQDYQDLRDARDSALAMRDVASGAMPTISADEVDAYLAATSPLAFWRGRSGKTQAVLAAEVGVSQPFLAQIEAGKRGGTAAVLARIDRALRVRIEDLIGE